MEDHDACNLIALSVGSVMRQSLDDGFKGECKKLLQATNTKMAEEILYKKLMETIQIGSHISQSAQDGPPSEIMPTTSSTGQGEPSSSENAPCATTSNAATSLISTTAVAATTQTAVSCAQRNMQLGEMYCRMIQKRSLSPQLAESEPLLTLKKEKQSSAPF